MRGHESATGRGRTSGLLSRHWLGCSCPVQEPEVELTKPRRRGAPPAFVCRLPVSGVRPGAPPVRCPPPHVACRHGPQRCRCAEAGERQARLQGGRAGASPAWRVPAGLVGQASRFLGPGLSRRASAVCRGLWAGAGPGSRRWLGASSSRVGCAPSRPSLRKGSSGHGF